MHVYCVEVNDYGMVNGEDWSEVRYFGSGDKEKAILHYHHCCDMMETAKRAGYIKLSKDELANSMVSDLVAAALNDGGWIEKSRVLDSMRLEA